MEKFAERGPVALPGVQQVRGVVQQREACPTSGLPKRALWNGGAGAPLYYREGSLSKKPLSPAGVEPVSYLVIISFCRQPNVI